MDMTQLVKTHLMTVKGAAEQYKIPERDLWDLIESGSIKLFTLDNGDDRMWLVARDEIAAVAAERFIRREDFKHLEGVKISISDASFKYHFHTGTISKWIRQGHITVLERTPNWVYISEADIAYAAALRDLKGIRAGRDLWKTGA